MVRYLPVRAEEGHGVVQWYEHGRPIDRFEGVFRRGKREGFGRYDWPAGQRYQGTYGRPAERQGTVTIDGASLAGSWRRGCLARRQRIAIGFRSAPAGRPSRRSRRWCHVRLFDHLVGHV